ncbi:hypothetical protein HDV03_003723 [Kappamyces sp. JEL0829]|nr:hypothetical protein HDV03_003723 [Kappamyces sp. JEL0829]
MSTRYNPYLAHLQEPTDSPETRHNYSERKKIIHQDRGPKKQAVSLVKNPHFQHGNYHAYYGYRNQGVADGRLAFIKPEWVLGKRVLDIGCNQGDLALQLARLNPALVVGVDIDPVLVAKARHLKQLARSCARANEDGTVAWDYFPPSLVSQFGAVALVNDPTAPDLLQNVQFRCGDWVHEPTLPEQFDLLLALSISKWIHLNNGDGGIRHFFNKCYDSLAPGGLFVFEPQAFDGYAKRAGLSQTMRQNYLEMEFFPSEFLYFLQKRVGFSLIDTFTPSHASTGFARTIYLLRK